MPDEMLQFLTDAMPGETAWLLGLALLASVAGFYRLVYFISIGYGLAIAAMALAAAWLFRAQLDAWLLAQCLLLLLYGLRLGGFLLLRELQPSYRRELAEVQQRARGVGAGRKLLIWVGVALLYLLMFAPCLFNLAARRGDPQLSLPALPVGVVIMALGLLLESAADQQKARFKRRQPRRFCDVGLYRWVRCPNYLGEVVFWVGQFVAGISGFGHGLHWLLSGAGLLCIVLVMIGSTRRLELKQDARYGTDPDYQHYVRTVPVLVPLLPIYSVKNARIYLG